VKEGDVAIREVEACCAGARLTGTAERRWAIALAPRSRRFVDHACLDAQENLARQLAPHSRAAQSSGCDPGTRSGGKTTAEAAFDGGLDNVGVRGGLTWLVGARSTCRRGHRVMAGGGSTTISALGSCHAPMEPRAKSEQGRHLEPDRNATT